MTAEPDASSTPARLPAGGNSLRDSRRRPLAADPPNQSEARPPDGRRLSKRAGYVAAAACVCTATSLLLSVALMTALTTDSAAQDALFVLGAIIGTTGIVLAVFAICLSGRMPPAQRRLAIASITMAAIQVLIVPLLALFGLASFYNNF